MRQISTGRFKYATRSKYNSCGFGPGPDSGTVRFVPEASRAEERAAEQRAQRAADPRRAARQSARAAGYGRYSGATWAVRERSATDERTAYGGLRRKPRPSSRRVST